MCNDNGNTFIEKSHSVFLAPDLCYRLISIITIMNLVNNCLFHKGFCTVHFGNEKGNAVTLPQSAQRKHAFLVKIKENTKPKKISPRKKVAFKLLHYRLGHLYTR